MVAIRDYRWRATSHVFKTFSSLRSERIFRPKPTQSVFSRVTAGSVKTRESVVADQLLKAVPDPLDLQLIELADQGDLPLLLRKDS